MTFTATEKESGRFESIDCIVSNSGFSGVYSTKTNSADGADMVWVPGGSFPMGSVTGVGLQYEHPQHIVYLDSYWIYKYDVTVAEYRVFCATTGHALPLWPGNYGSWAGKTGWDDPALQQHPIVNVTWVDAQAYAAWAGGSLPTEAQWEKAARGTDGRNYPWGGTATAADPNNGWSRTKCVNNFGSYDNTVSTWPVGSFPTGVSPYGAMDMAGEVWQWCADWYGAYNITALRNPTGPATGPGRVVRGSCWDNGDYHCATRFDWAPTYNYNNLGFRCVSSAPGP